MVPRLLQPRAWRPWQGLCKPLIHVAVHHHQMSPEQALKTCHAACVLHIRRAMLMLIWWTVDGVFADMFVCVHEDMHPGVFRPDGSPPGTIHSLIHTVDKSVYKGLIHRRINVSETAPRRPSQSLELYRRSRASPAPLRRTRACTRPHKTGYRTVCQTCARSVRHPVSRLMPHGGTLVPSKLVTVSCLSPV